MGLGEKPTLSEGFLKVEALDELMRVKDSRGRVIAKGWTVEELRDKVSRRMMLENKTYKGLDLSALDHPQE